MINTIEERVISWLLSGDTGNSAKTIVKYFLQACNDIYFRSNSMFPYKISKITTPAVPICPSDFDDFERCYKLLEIIPEWKEKIHNIAKLSPQWETLIDNWDAIEKRYLEREKYGWLDNYSFYRKYFDGQCLICTYARNVFYNNKTKSTEIECWLDTKKPLKVVATDICNMYSRKIG